MTAIDRPLGRRSIMAAAGLGLGAGLVADLVPAAAAAAPLWSGEYWAKKSEVALYLYRKRVAPKPRLSRVSKLGKSP